jgi:hypothetical protein
MTIQQKPIPLQAQTLSFPGLGCASYPIGSRVQAFTEP